jgi:hypothetical protein
MMTDTTTIVDEAIERLQILRGVFADDISMCQRAGLMRQAQQCRAALDAIAVVLPRLADARELQAAASAGAPRECPYCD